MHDYFEGCFGLAHVTDIHFLWLCPCTRSARMSVCVTYKLLKQFVRIQVFIVPTFGLLHAYFVCCEVCVCKR